MQKQKALFQARRMGMLLGLGDKQSLARLLLLAKAGYTTVKSLKAATDGELLAVSGIGRVAVTQLREALK